MLLALFAYCPCAALGDALMRWSSCGLVAWKWEAKAVPVRHATPGSSQSFPAGAGLRSLGCGQLGSFQAVIARYQVQKRSCFCCALCSKVTSEPRAGVCEDREMLFAALIHTCWC